MWQKSAIGEYDEEFAQEEGQDRPPEGNDFPTKTDYEGTLASQKVGKEYSR